MIKLEYRGKPKWRDICGYATALSAGCDVVLQKTVTIKPKEVKLLPTGLYVVPAPDDIVDAITFSLYELQIRPRSGISMLYPELRIPNSPGTVDADYRQEIMVLMYNSGSLQILIEGTKIAQLIAAPTVQLKGVPHSTADGSTDGTSKDSTDTVEEERRSSTATQRNDKVDSAPPTI